MSNNLIVEREEAYRAGTSHRRVARGVGRAAARHVERDRRAGGEVQLILRELFGTLSPWEKVHMARHPNRPTSLDYIARFDRFDELHGDRHFRDDPSIVGGLGTLGARNVMVLGQQRGRDTKEICIATLGCRRRKVIAKRRALPGSHRDCSCRS